MNQQAFFFRTFTSIARFFLTYGLFYSFFFDPGLNLQICGPFAIPANKSLFNVVLWIEIFRIFYPIIPSILSKTQNRHSPLLKLAKLYFFKYLIILFFKMMVIFDQIHRLRYYAHTLFLQVVILASCAVFDFSTLNIAEVWEIIVTDSLHRIALAYEISRTFCPNFALYWFIFNFLALGMSQVQAHNVNPAAFYRNQITYKTSLYVKQDVYRIMVLGFVYFALFSILQVGAYGWGMVITFIVASGPFWLGITSFDKGKSLKSLCLLLLTCLVLVGFIKMRVIFPHLFKELGEVSEEFVCQSYKILFQNKQ